MKHEWREWFAWHPVIVHGKIMWLTTVYCRMVDDPQPIDSMQGGAEFYWEYGTLFDVLREAS